MKKRDFNTLLTLAQQNDPEAQLDLAYCYAEGNGVEKKITEAIYWWTRLAKTEPNEDERDNYSDEEWAVFNKAAEYIPEAMYELGYHYYNGIGVEKNYEEAVKCFNKSGTVHAFNDLAVCYYYGQGVKQDYENALKYFKYAAYQWHPESHYYLGLFYSEGNLVKKDKRVAANWFVLAARGFYVTGKWNYESMHYDLAKKFYEQAMDAWKKAASMNYAEAKYQLDKCCYYNQLTEDELKKIDDEYFDRQFDIVDVATPWKRSYERYIQREENIFDYVPEEVNVGDNIYHIAFGRGSVIQRNDSYITIEFAHVGQKTFANPTAFIDGYLYKPSNT